MFIQTVIQTLLRKRKKAESTPKPSTPTAENELSPMAQRIMQKLAEHEKNAAHGSKKEGAMEDKDA
ncbi:hypothetical protein DCO17_03205 [Polynucleobacter tropicus]|uniref:Uncharacterized protein n=1 Tax=Polynucleobacter tropicus TaxID=1743174 RepID=A0A6M9PUI1_9BURK|nr:hypothetical protein [Polynucleobacter tropicus]QKM64329.1 hypothetical protein DCO17_03205 [Polynucleobacter tropicus]